MGWRNTSMRWGRVMRWLHWATAALVFALAAIGLLMTEMANSLYKVKVYALHKSLGVTVLALTLLRLLWRSFDRCRPQASATLGAQRAARIVHVGLYALLIAVPLSGWAFNSAANFALRWFGLINLPRLVPPSQAWKLWLRILHESLFWALAVLVLVHVVAALWHHFVLRDAVLARMLPMPRRWRNGQEAS